MISQRNFELKRIKIKILRALDLIGHHLHNLNFFKQTQEKELILEVKIDNICRINC